ncbi:5204_t:CDS:2 [Acaulospora morrowiae]|uniref:5204_t:CDS:1 n=1 Tax=Acaulospora morrowiae TaxID=94023 RepID=A0A9N9FEI0_9GLOM|nr:5204_t:CDS:2 [Acaulospora morrowiae]
MPLFAVFMVAAPPFLPCPAFDETQRKALLEERLKAAKLAENDRKKVVVMAKNQKFVAVISPEVGGDHE